MWRPPKFGTNHVDAVDQDDNYEYAEEREEDGDEQGGQDVHEDEQCRCVSIRRMSLRARSRLQRRGTRLRLV